MLLKPNFVLSPTGISLLISAAKGEQTKISLVNKYANVQAPELVPTEDRQILLGLIEAAKANLQQADLAKIARLSAELNGVIRFYGSQMEHQRDYHQFLCTDTWLGEAAAQMAATWLQSVTHSTVDVYRLKDLQTDDLDCFQSALSELTRWSEETIPAFRSQEYIIIFNLTGGFKSVQGFLQILANFYADETVYVFERSEHLLRIPRLPIRMVPAAIIREKLPQLRRLALDLPIDIISGVPETLLLKIDDQLAGLSTWGKLVWNQVKGQLYSEQLHPSPSIVIGFSDNFERSVRQLTPDRIRLVNERLDQLARCLENQGKYNLSSLDFKELKGKVNLPSTHELDAWADGDARRIYGHFEGNSFILDKLDKALH